MRFPRRRAIIALVTLAPPFYLVAMGAYLMGWGSQNRARKADAIIVFGARVQRGGSASPILRQRTRHAFELWRDGLAPTIVCTGGIGSYPPAEALVEKQLLHQWGVPERAIRVDAASTSTRENARNAAALLPRGARVIAVSEAFHLWRCARDSAQVGLQVATSPETLGWNALSRRDRAFYLLREVMAVSRDWFFDRF